MAAMSKVIFTIAFLLLLFSQTFCQDYSLINKDRVYYYASNNGGDLNVNTIRIDSVFANGIDSTFFNFKIFAPDTYCITLQHKGWLGNKIIKYSNGDYCFFKS